MSASTLEWEPSDPVALARRFLESLRDGRLVDALDTLSPDAVISDETGHDRHGIREITASLLPYRIPSRLAADRVEAHGSVVSAVVRIPAGPGGRDRRYRARIQVRAGRIHSVGFRPA